MVRRKTTKEEKLFISTVPEKYRIAVIILFHEYREENDWATPLNIIQDISDNSEMTYDEVYDACYDRIDKIKQGRLTAKNDPIFHKLVSDFLHRHAPEKFSKVYLPDELNQYGKFLHNYFMQRRSFGGYNRKKYIEDLKYKNNNLLICELTAKKTKHFHENCYKSNYSSRLNNTANLANHRYFFIILVCRHLHFDIVISFDDSINNEVYFGVYLETQGIFSLKGNYDNDILQFALMTTLYKIYGDDESNSAVLQRTLCKYGTRDVPECFPNYFWQAMDTNAYGFYLERVENKLEEKYLIERSEKILNDTGLNKILT